MFGDDNILKYSNQDLIENLQRYYLETGIMPTTRNLNKKSYMANDETYRNRFGSFKNALIEAGLYDNVKNKNMFDRYKYTEEELLTLLNNYIIEYKIIPTINNINSDPNMPNCITYYRHFGNLNNAIKLLGYTPINRNTINRSSYSKEDLINKLKELYLQLNKTPSARDINKSDICPHSELYLYYFGSLYNALDIAKISYNKRTRFYTDKEILEYWYKLKDKLKKCPTLIEIKNSKINIVSSIQLRWGGYYNFLKTINELENYNGKRYFSKNGVLCLSYYELLITNFLEENNINFIKEYNYNKVIKDYYGTKRFDWVIFHNNIVYYVECFGIESSDKYNKKINEKIKLCQDNNINLICIYPKDFKNSLEEIFSFLN